MASPSIPLAELSAPPEHEVRQAALRVEGEDRPVQIWYRHTDATDVVDGMTVTSI